MLLKTLFKGFLIWLVIILCAVAVAAGVLPPFLEKHPEKTLRIGHAITAVIEQITLPIKLAELALREPDQQIRMPVYGSRVSQVSDSWHTPRGADRLHEGQDIFAPRGTPVFSGTYGYVRRIGQSTLGGTIVFVTGAGGRRYYYAHLDRVAEGLRPGQEVTTDTVLGFVGNTGNAATTPSHLHFGVYQSRQAINPLPLLVDR